MASICNTDEYGGVWVYVEQLNGKPARVSIELLGRAGQLADKLGVELSAFMIGESVGELAKELITYGADRVMMVDAPQVKDYQNELYTDIISEAARKRNPEVLLMGASPIGRDLAPRLSFRLNTGCTADCTNLDIDEKDGLLVSTRPAFGGNVMATITCPEHRPQMATVRPGVLPLPQRDEERNGEIIHLDPHTERKDPRVSIIEDLKQTTAGTGIDEADRIVAIGMGAGDGEAVAMVNELAGLLDAEVAASRSAVEAGWLSHASQVGQTGKTVRPTLYVACGISGAVQHTAGMSESKIVVAINKDPNAEIMKVADYAIVGDVKETVAALIEEMKKLGT